MRKPHIGFGKDGCVLKIKFKVLLITLVLLWGIAFIQICMTRFYVSQEAFTQAFARNKITVTKEAESATDTRNVAEENVCKEGTVEGRLSETERVRIARDIFRQFGGAEVMSGDAKNANYYVAYGYTNGVEHYKRVNNKRININVAMTYDERADKTRIVIGTPLINSDF